MQVIENLKTEVNNIGLTNINKIVRRLDLLNDKYKITDSVEYLPLISALTACGIYFTPEVYLKDIPVLKDIQKFLKTPAYNSPDFINHKNNIENEEKDDNKYKSNLAGVFNIFDSRMFSVLTFTSAVYFSKSPLTPFANMLKAIISNRWNKLKGFKVEDLIKGRGEIVKDLTLDDEMLIGLDNQIQELHKLVNYMVNPEIYDQSRTGLDKGILLVGPSRSGKTLLARALCGTLNKAMKDKGYSTQFAFKEVKPADLYEYKGGFKKVIEQAKLDAPCVLFIDELHNLSLQTKKYGGNLLTDFLTEMSGIDSQADARHQFIILGATDRPHLLDNSLLQPGRFGNIIYFEKPNYKNRKKYFEINLKYSSIDTKNIDIDLLVRQTQNCSYGDLEYIVKNTLFTAHSRSQEVTQDMFQEQINKHVYKLKRDINLTEFEKKHIAVHQAGHALAHILINPNNRLELVTIAGSWYKIKEVGLGGHIKPKSKHIKSTKYNGLFTYCPSESLDIEPLQEKIKLAKIKVAGRLAEKLLLGSYGANANRTSKQNIFHAKDRTKALNYLKLLLFDGLDESLIPQKAKKDLESKAYNMLLEIESQVYELLNNNRYALERIAKELEDKTTLTINDIKKIIN